MYPQFEIEEDLGPQVLSEEDAQSTDVADSFKERVIHVKPIHVFSGVIIILVGAAAIFVIKDFIDNYFFKKKMNSINQTASGLGSVVSQIINSLGVNK